MIAARIASVAVVIALTCASGVAAQDPADAAWNRGDHDVARELYAARVAADSSDVRALHRLALLYAWDREFAPAVGLFDHLLTVSPENVEARVDRARVLSWAGRFDEAADGYVGVLNARPGERRARLGLAQVLAWSGQLDSARAVYDALLRDAPDDLEAQQGLARVTAWSGRLRAAEEQWHRTLELADDDSAALIGLSQTLRWQGRADAALAALDRVPLEERTRPEYVEERRWVEVALSAALSSALTFETDSDANDMLTVTLNGMHPVAPRLRVGVDAYFRAATGEWEQQVTETRQAWGLMATGRYVVEPGWGFVAGLGISNSSGADAPLRPAIRLSASSPAREPIGGSVMVRHSAFDYTALLMENGVTFSEAAVTGRARPAYRWHLDAGFSYARFNGSESNRRLAGHLAGTRTITPAWAAGARLRSFGFQKNLNDGYFDPSFYFLGELIGRWQPLRGPWHVTAEVAPGLEHIAGAGGMRATIRLVAQGAYDIAPGRQVRLGAVYTNAGLQSFTAGAGGYRYFAMTLSGSWSF